MVHGKQGSERYSRLHEDTQRVCSGAGIFFLLLAVRPGMCDLSSLKGTEPMLPAMEAWSLNHWPTREVLWSWHLNLGPTDSKCHILSLPCPGDQKSVFVFCCWHKKRTGLAAQFSSVAQSCPTLCDPRDCSMPGFPVHHQLPEPTMSILCQTHVSRVGDVFQLSHPLSSPSPPAFKLSQRKGLFKWVSSSHQVAKVLKFQLQHQSFQWIFRTDFL